MEEIKFYILIGSQLVSLGVMYGVFKTKISTLERQQQHDSEKFKEVWDELKDKASNEMVRDFKADLRNEINGLKEYIRGLINK